MLFSFFVFGCMQDEPKIDKNFSQKTTQSVQEIRKEKVEQEHSSVLETKEPVTKKEVQEALELTPNPSQKIETETSERETLASKEVPPTETVDNKTTETVEKKEETPKVKKKVQYSKPNRMCVSKIKKVLKAKNGEISFCYDKQKFKNPTLEGSITVQINVHKSRNSIWVKKDTLKDKDFRSCMKSKIRDWNFGPDCYGASFKKSYKLVSG